MSPTVLFILCVVLIVGGFFVHDHYNSARAVLGWLMFLAGALCGVVSCDTSEGTRTRRREEVVQKQADAQPRVIREIDGCKVYAFKSERWMYFTRCADQTTTESSYEVNCGKNCRRTEVDTMTTNNVPAR